MYCYVNVAVLVLPVVNGALRFLSLLDQGRNLRGGLFRYRSTWQSARASVVIKSTKLKFYFKSADVAQTGTHAHRLLASSIRDHDQ